MSTSDPIAKKNELLSTIPGSRQNEASVDAITERNQIRQDASTVLDEFGLPAKVSHKRSHSFTKDENRAEDSGHQAQFQERSEGPWPPSQFSALGQIVEHRSQNGNLVGTRRSSCESSASKEFPDSLHTGLNGSNHKIREDQEVSSHTMEKELPISDRGAVIAPGGISGWSHQAIAPHTADANGHDHEDEWQDMPAFAPYDLYDEEGKLIAKEARESDDEDNAYTGLGGAGKGYTRVQIDEDAQSATSMDDNTSYLFKTNDAHVFEEDEEQRDPLAQMQATKNLLTEGQRIAYVGVTKLTIAEMAKELDDMEQTKGTKKEIKVAADSMRMWGQQMMLRLYAHMDISSSEQIMIEQLAEHGVQPSDLTPALMQNSRVDNPMAEKSLSNRESISSSQSKDEEQVSGSHSASPEPYKKEEIASIPRPAEHVSDEVPEVRTPSQLPTTKCIDIDLRWTVLCDLFLLLIADSIYDSRSRVLLERVGTAVKVSWLEICRFEKRVTEALEMQEAASKETWDEAEHMENRRKLALKRKYVMMGLATVGGSLVIGLSAGLLAPVIGAGLAAGFTTIGVAGTSGFLAGAGGTALITSGAVVTGGTIAVRASHRRTGAVQTFEYRPLHNNKRVNLIVTVSGWMNGKIDDVRLPYSTIDPIMGDMYSVLWEPEMLQSMGDTINILATEALTQGLQQVLGSTILVALMASLQLPIVLTKLSYLIDNPWTVSLGRANAAGLILADSLIDRNLGVRPITLVGFSLGSRVIFACLRELAGRGAVGLVQNVYLFGSPIVANKDEYLRARAVVSGRFVNGYASNDWILGYLFRATSGGIMRVAGLAPVTGIHGLENIDVTKLVNGHMAYRASMPRLLREVGWEVESDEFTEIEDPDPENHEKRQRELIREIDEARREAEFKPEKRRFGFFKRGKLAEKKGWETYDDRMKGEQPDKNSVDGGSSNVLFDIEAIRAELASEQIEVKQLESTLPPMKLNLNETLSSYEAEQNPRLCLRETKSYDGSMAFRPKISGDTSQTSLPNAQPLNPFDQGYDDNTRFDKSESPKRSIENTKMSFDNPQRSPSPAIKDHPQGLSLSDRSPSPLKQSQTLGTSLASQESFMTTPLTQGKGPNSMVTPTDLDMPNLERNAWLDEEDEEFGKEKEVTLSFA